MNLALSAVLILLLLLPAFSFRIGISVPLPSRRDRNPTDAGDLRQQLTGRNVSKALSKLNFTETIFLFSIVPVVLHLASFCLIRLTGHTVRFDLLLNVFAGKPNVLSVADNGAFQGYLISFLWYSLAQAVGGLLLGVLFSKVFLGREWTLRLVMGNNIWYKLFTGTTLPKEKRKEIAFILVEALALTKETTVIYSGWLKNYEVAQNSDELSYLTLTGAKRRDLRAAHTVNKNPSGTTESISSYQDSYGPLVEIPGHNFTLLGKEILNVNVTYLGLQEDAATKKKILVPLA